MRKIARRQTKFTLQFAMLLRGRTSKSGSPKPHFIQHDSRPARLQSGHCRAQAHSLVAVVANLGQDSPELVWACFAQMNQAQTSWGESGARFATMATRL